MILNPYTETVLNSVPLVFSVDYNDLLNLIATIENMVKAKSLNRGNANALISIINNALSIGQEYQDF